MKGKGQTLPEVGTSRSFWRTGEIEGSRDELVDLTSVVTDSRQEESDDEDILDVCCCTQPVDSSSPTVSFHSARVLFCSKPGRLMLFVISVFCIYLIYSGFTSNTAEADDAQSSADAGTFNRSRARSALSDLCKAYDARKVSGDLCNRLCFERSWNILEFYEGNKIVIIIKQGGQEVVLKSQHPTIDEFDHIDYRVNESVFTDALLEVVNYNLRLGWPAHYKRHLVETVWPMYTRTSHTPLSEADRRSLWALLSQDEYITFRVLPLTRVTPKIVGTCGHFYQVEHLVAFRMKGYYMNLKAKILVHLMGTLKLFDEFLNEPLQWCDVKFDNLGLAAEYPKRFMIMDGDMLYTKTRLKAMLTSRKCSSDQDCSFFDCESQCSNSTGHCSDRTNNNVDVFCKKLVRQLFGNFWTKSNRYLAACHDTSIPIEQRLADLRLTWSWNLSDV